MNWVDSSDFFLPELGVSRAETRPAEGTESGGRGRGRGSSNDAEMWGWG